MVGWCQEGPIEAALSAIEMLDVNEVKAKP